MVDVASAIATGSGRAMARFLGNSSPKIICRKIDKSRASTVPAATLTPVGTPIPPALRRARHPMSGSATNPTTRAVTVIPSCAPDSMKDVRWVTASARFAVGHEVARGRCDQQHHQKPQEQKQDPHPTCPCRDETRSASSAGPPRDMAAPQGPRSPALWFRLVRPRGPADPGPALVSTRRRSDGDPCAAQPAVDDRLRSIRSATRATRSTARNEQVGRGEVRAIQHERRVGDGDQRERVVDELVETGTALGSRFSKTPSMGLVGKIHYATGA